eukprot:6663353-Alexandrium_andersonii.AAC.1
MRDGRLVDAARWGRGLASGPPHAGGADSMRGERLVGAVRWDRGLASGRARSRSRELPAHRCP